MAGKSVRQGQQDCHDELKTLEQLLAALQLWGLLHYHSFAHQIVFTQIDEVGYDHAELMISEKNDPAKSWVVDSWPRDNGDVPDILPVKVWRAKYHPMPAVTAVEK